MSLSQIQIIRSLAEALAWFEKELAWNVEPAELRHLTGRIGELYAAMITRGQMAPDVNQRGYDVVSAEGHRISVKTITSSSHVSFRKSTLSHAQEAMVLRINKSDGEASIEELFRGTIAELRLVCRDVGDELQYVITKPPSGPAVLDGLAITDTVRIGSRRVIQYENGSIAVEVDGVRVPVVKPVLRDIAAELGISPLNGKGNELNTRQLGAEIIAGSDGEDQPARSSGNDELKVELDGLAITGSVEIGSRRVIQVETGSISVEVDGVPVPVVRPVLRDIAAQLGLSTLNGRGNELNTRQLGAAIIALATSKGQNAGSGGDDQHVAKDGDIAPIAD